MRRYLDTSDTGDGDKFRHVYPFGNNHLDLVRMLE